MINNVTNRTTNAIKTAGMLVSTVIPVTAEMLLFDTLSYAVAVML